MRNSQLTGSGKHGLHPTPELSPENYCRLIEKERKNTRLINLYSLGNGWVALEQSAYMLSRILPACSVMCASFPDYPFPVVMAMVTDKDIRSYTREHIIRRMSPSHYVLLGRDFSNDAYNIWHRKSLKV